MKQTVEEAAKEYAKSVIDSFGTNGVPSSISAIKGMITLGFENGAEWQAKQSPWISVKERLPEEGQKVFVLVICYGVPSIREEKFRRNSNLDRKERWIHGNSIVLAWMPIPSFDQILEANKDML